MLGLFHGAYFSIFLAESQFHVVTFFGGVAAGELLLIAVFTFILGRLARLHWMRRAVPVAASLLFAVGVVWFLVRLRA